MSELPAAAGATFKGEHFAAIRAAPPAVGFFEVHAENYMGAGGPAHAMLETLHRDHALSVHGVGLSIGGPDPLDTDHLDRVATVLDRHRPESFSEHLAWSTHEGVYYNDLLPLPYTPATLRTVIRHVSEVQERLGRRMLLENPATYMVFAESTIPEPDFLREVARRTGCGLLLDVNNVFVSAGNHGTDPAAYLAAFPLEAVGEIHLAGHDAVTDPDGGTVLIDSHGGPVADPVWDLFATVIARTGPLPTLIEWDNDVPAWPILRAEARRAQHLLDAAGRRAA